MKIFAAALSLAILGACASPATIAEETDNMPKTPATSLSAVGIGVADLDVSNTFYTDVIGMRPVATFNLDYMDEIVLVMPGGGSAIVLMEWTDGSERTLGSNGIKLVLRSPDPAALAARIRDAGYEIIREPTPSEAVGGAIVGFARDPDGYLLELLPLS
ncbi:VOC family protein [Henriciella sp. AS95]|uniref:VOC family protein n=1 Tax=Henriciella sp. AS95 TaxID=3135782 RepID=UPI003174B860